MLESLAERWPFSLPLSVAGALVALTVAALGTQLWKWQAALEPGAASASTRELDRPPENTLPMILSANLFGDANPDPQAGGAQQALATNTSYTLRAAFAGSSGGAVIEGSDGQARWYAIDASIAPGVQLKEVHPDHVILEQGGRREKLAFPTPAELAASASMVTSSAIGAAIATPAAATEGRAEPIPADVSPEEKARIVRERLEELRNRSRT